MDVPQCGIQMRSQCDGRSPRRWQRELFTGPFKTLGSVLRWRATACESGRSTHTCEKGESEKGERLTVCSLWGELP
eukprot:3876495-Amphidinium_carterae.1